MKHGSAPLMYQPRMGNRLEDGQTWAADNGCFNERTFVGEAAWLRWLSSARLRRHQDTCLFAVALDVVGDAAATAARSRPLLPMIHSFGYRAAFVAQDGIGATPPDWEQFEVLFIGGSTAFKLSEEAYALCIEAKARGKWLHIGRVNSLRRALAFKAVGADSADGTVLAFDPKRDVESWQATLDRKKGLGI